MGTDSEKASSLSQFDCWSPEFETGCQEQAWGVLRPYNLPTFPETGREAKQFNQNRLAVSTCHDPSQTASFFNVHHHFLRNYMTSE